MLNFTRRLLLHSSHLSFLDPESKYRGKTTRNNNLRRNRRLKHSETPSFLRVKVSITGRRGRNDGSHPTDRIKAAMDTASPSITIFEKHSQILAACYPSYSDQTRLTRRIERDFAEIRCRKIGGKKFSSACGSFLRTDRASGLGARVCLACQKFQRLGERRLWSCRAILKFDKFAHTRHAAELWKKRFANFLEAAGFANTIGHSPVYRWSRFLGSSCRLWETRKRNGGILPPYKIYIFPLWQSLFVVSTLRLQRTIHSSL